MKILELFCGRGGWSKGFKQIFPNAEFTGIDINDFSKIYPFEFLQKDLMDYTPEPIYDIILASPPCAEFSEVKRNCAHPYDERQGLDLIWRTHYILSVCKPRYWIIENVKGLAEFIPHSKGEKIMLNNSRKYAHDPQITPLKKNPQNEKIQYGLRSRKTAYLWSNKNIELGFFDFDMSDYNSRLWHGNITGWQQVREGLRGEIPLELSRHIALKIKKNYD